MRFGPSSQRVKLTSTTRAQKVTDYFLFLVKEALHIELTLWGFVVY
jgi:hypothetical protein